MYREELDYAQPALRGEQAARRGLRRTEVPADYRDDELRQWQSGFDRVQRLRAALGQRTGR